MTTIIRRLVALGQHAKRVLPALLSLGYFSVAVAGQTAPAQLIGTTQGYLEWAVENYLQRSGIEGRYEIQVNTLDPRLQLPSCEQSLDARLESPAQPIGRVTVRVSCTGLAPWTVFVPAQVLLYRDVATVNRPLKRGEILDEQDITMREQDVGNLQQGFLTEAAQAVGKKLRRPVVADQLLTPAHLEIAEMVERGDQVVIVARTGTINVRMPGEALAGGVEGEQIRVKNLTSQRVIKARVTAPGEVEVAM